MLVIVDQRTGEKPFSTAALFSILWKLLFPRPELNFSSLMGKRQQLNLEGQYGRDQNTSLRSQSPVCAEPFGVVVAMMISPRK